MALETRDIFVPPPIPEPDPESLKLWVVRFTNTFSTWLGRMQRVILETDFGGGSGSDSYLKRDGTTALTGNWSTGAYDMTGFDDLTGSGGSIFSGGSGSGEDLYLYSTTHATHGKIYLGTVSAYDEVNDRLGIGTAAPSDEIHVYHATNNVYVQIETDKTDGSAGWNIENDAQKWIFYVAGAASDVFAIADDTNSTTPVKIFPGADDNALCIDAGGDIGLGTSTPATSAKLDIDTTTGALLVSRMTTAQRDALTASNGMIIYNTSTTSMEVYQNSGWAKLGPGLGAEGAHVTHNANQTIATGSSGGAGPGGTNEHTISFNTELFDTDTMHDNTTNNSRLTVNTAGVYLVGFTGRIGDGVNDKQIWVSIHHLDSGGSQVSGSARSFTEDAFNFAETWGPVTFMLVDANATDYFEMGCRNESGGNVTLYGNVDWSPQFYCWRIGDAI
jgi:hypothetical protein